MNKIYTLLACIGFSIYGFSQVTDMGGPIAWKNKLSSKVLIPVETMPGYDQSAIDAEDAINDQSKDQPWRFGFKYQVNYSTENSGVWQDLPNGGRLWQLGLSCPGAMTVNLLLENFDLPEGAYLYLYDDDRTNRVGAYTARNNREDGQLGTELVHGDKIIVEYYEPAGVESGSFTITDVVHGYRSLKTVQDDLWQKALNSSGDCNIDVNCPLGTGWEDQIRSVAMIVVSGSGICTGALINNTCDDGTPYFLTANHCLGGGTGNWAFRFNWETPAANVSCATTANSTDPGPPYDQTANGATILVNGTQADHALLEIDNMTLTDAENWNLFYAGWDNSDNETVTEATGIHHPSGDVKKICREDNDPYHSTASGAQVWWIDDWDQGVTEPGSSGSPLFDQNGRIIGQLYGGAAACSGTNDNNAYDYYGRLGVSWGLGIGNYLAPTSCGSATTNDGWDPNQPTLADDAGIQAIISPDGQICADNFDPEVTLRNFGANTLTSVTINYDIDAGPNNTFNWTGSLASGATINVTLPNMTTTAGAHTFNAYTTLPNGATDSNASNDDASSSFNVVTGGEPVILELNTDCWGEEIYWEIEDGSSNVVASGGNTNVPPGGLQISDNNDPGAYGDEILITEDLCLTVGCYTFTIYDDYGDGLYGSQYGSCTVDGDYTIIDGNDMSILGSIQAANSDYGNSEVSNFCVVSPCGGTLSSTTVQEDCFGDDDGEITISVTGGTAPFTYDIGSGPQGSGTFTGLAQGTYTVTVEDGSACTSTIDVVLGGPAELTATSAGTDETCPGVNDGQIVVTATGGTAPLSYDIGSGSQGSGTFAGLGANTYNVTVTDDNGCVVNNNGITIITGTGVNATLSVTDISCNGLTDGEVQVVTSNGSAPFTYDIGSGAQGSDTFTGLSAGSYTVDITDNNGCTGQATGTVNEPAALTGSYTTTDEMSGNDGSIDLTPGGGTTPYTYSWSGPNGYTSSTQDPNNLEGGMYDVTITDANGCTLDVADIEVNSSVGFGENTINFVIYPNPSNGQFNVQLMNNEDRVQIDILDVTGRIVYAEEITGLSTFMIDISDKADGTYFFRLTSGDTQSTLPIINQ